MPLKIPPRKITLNGSNMQTSASSEPQYQSLNGFSKARQINEERDRMREMRANRPFEFNMKPREGGKEGRVVVLVDTVKKPNSPYFHYMHRWNYPDTKTEVCILDGPEGCPLCQFLNKKGTYELVLTCIDPKPYTYEKGPNKGKTVKRSKKPYIAKIQMIETFGRLYDKHGTFRGMVIRCFRDGDKVPAAGNSVEFVKMLSEKELAQFGDLAKPLDYTKAYPRLDAKKMAEIYNIEGGGSVGGADFDENAPLPF